MGPRGTQPMVWHVRPFRKERPAAAGRGVLQGGATGAAGAAGPPRKALGSPQTPPPLHASGGGSRHPAPPTAGRTQSPTPWLDSSPPALHGTDVDTNVFHSVVDVGAEVVVIARQIDHRFNERFHPEGRFESTIAGALLPAHTGTKSTPPLPQGWGQVK